MSQLVPVSRVARTAPTIPDRVTVWPLDGFSFGIDVTYEGASGAELAAQHEAGLQRAGVRYSFRQELYGAWTIRLTVPAGHVARVVAQFVGDEPLPPR